MEEKAVNVREAEDTTVSPKSTPYKEFEIRQEFGKLEDDAMRRRAHLARLIGDSEMAAARPKAPRVLGAPMTHQQIEVITETSSCSYKNLFSLFLASIYIYILQLTAQFVLL